MTGYFAHETAVIDPKAQVGEGTKIWHFSHVMAGAVIGKNCNLGQNVVISPGCTLGDGTKVQNNVSVYTGVNCAEGVFLGPSCVFTNVINPRAFIERKDEYRETPIEKGASIGANATIICGNRIGKYALIGAGAVVTKDVGDYELVVGNPARRIGYVCACGERLKEEQEIYACSACGKTYVFKEGVLKEREDSWV